MQKPGFTIQNRHVVLSWLTCGEVRPIDASEGNPVLRLYVAIQTAAAASYFDGLHHECFPPRFYKDQSPDNPGDLLVRIPDASLPHVTVARRSENSAQTCFVRINPLYYSVVHLKIRCSISAIINSPRGRPLRGLVLRHTIHFRNISGSFQPFSSASVTVVRSQTSAGP